MLELLRNEEIMIDLNCVCVFCGKEKKRLWDEATPYYECECKAAQYERKILKEMSELKRKLPQPMYEVITKNVLRKIKY